MIEQLLAQTISGQAIWLNLLVIIALFVFGKFILGRTIKSIIKLTDKDGEENQSTLEKRAETIGNALQSIGNVAIYIIIAIMILGMFGVDIRPILAGIGILGLAIGFGAQSLVKDFVAGFFIILEGQYDVGDKVKIGTAEGKVRKLTLRSTVLKDEEGRRHYISNGSINNVVNQSQK